MNNLTNLITTISTGANNNTFASTEQIAVITGLIAVISLTGYIFHKIQHRAYGK